MLGDSHRYERRQKISAPDGWTGERLPCGTLTRLVERLRWLAGLGALPPVPRCRCSKWNTWQAAPDIRGGIGTRLPRTRTVFHVEQWIWPGAEGLLLPSPVTCGPGVRSCRTYCNVFHVEHCTSVLPRENSSCGCSQSSCVPRGTTRLRHRPLQSAALLRSPPAACGQWRSTWNSKQSESPGTHLDDGWVTPSSGIRNGPPDLNRRPLSQPCSRGADVAVSPARPSLAVARGFVKRCVRREQEREEVNSRTWHRLRQGCDEARCSTWNTPVNDPWQARGGWQTGALLATLDDDPGRGLSNGCVADAARANPVEPGDEEPEQPAHPSTDKLCSTWNTDCPVLAGYRWSACLHWTPGDVPRGTATEARSARGRGTAPSPAMRALVPRAAGRTQAKPPQTQPLPIRADDNNTPAGLATKHRPSLEKPGRAPPPGRQRAYLCVAAASLRVPRGSRV